MRTTNIAYRKMGRQGSALIFSLLILSLILVSAMALVGASLANRRASLATSKSTAAFQIADSGAEDVLGKLRGSLVTDKLRDVLGSDCSGSAYEPSGKNYKVTFSNDGSEIRCDDTVGELGDDGKGRIKSTATYQNIQRSVEVPFETGTTAL
jgi:hypothetical protein